jgi:hypothetical protein
MPTAPVVAAAAPLNPHMNSNNKNGLSGEGLFYKHAVLGHEIEYLMSGSAKDFLLGTSP